MGGLRGYVATAPLIGSSIFSFPLAQVAQGTESEREKRKCSYKVSLTYPGEPKKYPIRKLMVGEYAARLTDLRECNPGYISGRSGYYKGRHGAYIRIRQESDSQLQFAYPSYMSKIHFQLVLCGSESGVPVFYQGHLEKGEDGRWSQEVSLSDKPHFKLPESTCNSSAARSMNQE